MAWKLILFFSILACNAALCQTINVKVLSKEDNQCIPFTYISDNNKNKWFTNEFGEAEIETSSLQDTLHFQSLGFYTNSVSVQTLQAQDTIWLTPKTINLEEVTVSAKRVRLKSTSLGIKSRGNEQNNFSGKTYEIKAFYIPNDQKLNGYIQKVNVFISDDGTPSSYFRVHIYDCDPLKFMPGKELTVKNVFMQGSMGNEWLQSNVADQYIKIPINGIFVGIEWLEHSSTEQHKKIIKGKDFSYEIDANGVMIRSIEKPLLNFANSIFVKREGEWIVQSNCDLQAYKDRGVTNLEDWVVSVPCINVEVNYSSKIKEDKEPTPIRKRVRMDEVRYPQRSISELVNSLILATEDNNLEYIAKFLYSLTTEQLNFLDDQLDERDAGSRWREDERSRYMRELRKLKQSIDNGELIEEEEKLFRVEIGLVTYYFLYHNSLWKMREERSITSWY